MKKHLLFLLFTITAFSQSLHQGGISPAAIFKINEAAPIDERLVVSSFDSLDGLANKYNGLITSSLSDHKPYYNDFGIWRGIAFTTDMPNVDVVASIADLIAYNGTKNVIFVRDTDRGGWFNLKYNTTLAPDGGESFTAHAIGTGFYWQRDITQAKGVNPKWYGAKGDYNFVTHTGTDDSAALQAAINASINKNTYVSITDGLYRVTVPLLYGEGTTIVGQNTLFPYQLSGTDTIRYHSQTALVWTTDVNGFEPTQDVVTYRNQGTSIKDLGIFGSGKNNGKIGVIYKSNPNTSTPIKRSGLCYLEHCYVDGWDTGASANVSLDGSGDSWTLEKNHFSNSKYGVITGNLGESFGYFNDFYNIDIASVTLNGNNEIWEGNEMEPGLAATSFVIGTARAFNIHHNVFTQNATAINVTASGGRGQFNHNIVKNCTSHSVIATNCLNFEVIGNTFSEGTEVATTTQNFINATGTTGLVIKLNNFVKYGGGQTAPINITNGTLSAISENRVYSFSGNDQSSFVFNGTNTFAKGQFYGQQNFISTDTNPAIKVTGGTSSSGIFEFERVLGLTQKYSVHILGGVGQRLTFRDATTGNDVLSMGMQDTRPTVKAGANASGTAGGAASQFMGLDASGANQVGGDSYNGPGTSTGNAPSARYVITSTVPTVSGSGLHPKTETVVVQNNTTTFNGKVVNVDDTEFSASAKGVILRSPDGTKYRVTVANGGALTTTVVP